MQEITLTNTPNDNLHQFSEIAVSWLSQNQWFFAALLLIDVVYIVSSVIGASKQKKENSRITNMFNEDGSRRKHSGQKKYHILTPMFLGVLICFIWYIVFIL